MGNGAHTGGLACLHASPGGSSAPAPHPHGSPCSATAVTLVLRWWQGHVGEHPGTSIGHKPHSTLGRGLVAALPTLGLQSCGSRGSDSGGLSTTPDQEYEGYNLLGSPVPHRLWQQAFGNRRLASPPQSGQHFHFALGPTSYEACHVCQSHLRTCQLDMGLKACWDLRKREIKKKENQPWFRQLSCIVGISKYLFSPDLTWPALIPTTDKFLTLEGAK